MKKVLMTTALTLACVAAFAQTPANPAKAVEQGAVPTAPKTAAAADAKVDARKAANPGADGTMVKQTPVTGEVPAGSKSAASKGQMNVETRDLRAMDTNGDGMISRKEYDAYHNAMWKQMKAKKDMVSMDEMLKQGGAR